MKIKSDKTRLENAAIFALEVVAKNKIKFLYK